MYVYIYIYIYIKLIRSFYLKCTSYVMFKYSYLLLFFGEPASSLCNFFCWWGWCVGNGW